MTAVTKIYVRYSPRPAREGEAERIAAAEDAETLKLQIDVCERLAVMQQLKVDEIIRDPETSARKERLFDREGGSRLKDLPRGSHIICAKLDRMFRNTADGLTTAEYFKDRGVKLHFADQGNCTIDTSTGTGEFIFTILLANTSLEPRLTADRTSRGMKHRMKLGQRMTREGHEPYGEMTGEQEIATKIVNSHNDGKTYCEIAKELNDAGFRKRCGAKWDYKLVRSVVLRKQDA